MLPDNPYEAPQAGLQPSPQAAPTNTRTWSICGLLLLASAINYMDRQTLANWLDERIVSFVKSYLAVHQNNYYLKDHLVEDPIAKVRFPKYAAGATLQWNGKTVYFLGDETRRQFEQQQGTTAGR